MELKVTDMDIQEAEKVEMSPDAIMRLVDLIFLCRDSKDDLPS